MATRLIIGCNYHTRWQSNKSMRFVLSGLSDDKKLAQLRTRTTGKVFWTSVEELIFINSLHNKQKAEKLEGKYEKV